MKKFYSIIILAICITLIFIVSVYSVDKTHVDSIATYYMEDFQSIVVGKSTYMDVYNIAPFDSVYITSYGFFCEFPTENGNVIRIKFYGEDMIVGMIEITSPTKES